MCISISLSLYIYISLLVLGTLRLGRRRRSLKLSDTRGGLTEQAASDQLRNTLPHSYSIPVHLLCRSLLALSPDPLLWHMRRFCRLSMSKSTCPSWTVLYISLGDFRSTGPAQTASCCPWGLIKALGHNRRTDRTSCER